MGQQAGQQLGLQGAVTTSPFCDIFDSPESLTVFCDLPGVQSENIRLEGDDRTLRIVAERKPSEQEEGLEPLQQERARRAERIIQLPAAVNLEEAEATCENGVCTITLPKDKKGVIGVQ